MKILKHGKKFNKEKIVTCDLCGCKFEYDNNDTETEKSFCFMTYPPTYKTYVKCPECNADILLGITNQEVFLVKENSIEEDIKNAEHFIKSIKTDKEYKEENGWHGYYNKEIVELARILEHILSDYKRVLKINEVLLKENEGLKEYIAIALNLDEMTATKYRNIQQDAYIQGRAEEQQKAEQVIHENYIPKQKIKDKIEEINKMIAYEHNNAVIIQLGKQKRVLRKLLESEE